MKYQIITYKDMCRLLKANGYTLDRCSGDHTIWVKEGCNHISINKCLNPLVARRLIKENNLGLIVRHPKAYASVFKRA